MTRRLGQALACVGLLALAACATSDGLTGQEQALADGTACVKRGYVLGTDAFAGCTWRAARHRDDDVVADRLRRAQEAATVRRRQEALRELSVARDGDLHFPVCGGSSRGAHVDNATYSWFGEGCREK